MTGGVLFPNAKGARGITQAEAVELVRRFQAGDEDALATLIRKSRPLLARAWQRFRPRSLTGLRDDEEALYVDVWRAAQEYDPEGVKWASWLTCFVRRRCMNMWRDAMTKRRYPEGAAIVSESQFATYMVTPKELARKHWSVLDRDVRRHGTEQDERWRDDRVGDIAVAMDRLGIIESDIIRRRYLQPEPDTQRMIATHYGVSQQRIQQIEAKTLARLRELLANEGAA